MVQVDINGFKNKPFKIERLIKKFFPLSLVLFIINFNSLFYLLTNSSLSIRFKGIFIPNAEELANIQFANDTTLYFELNERSIDLLIANINMFCKALGEKSLPLNHFYLVGRTCQCISFPSLTSVREGLINKSDILVSFFFSQNFPKIKVVMSHTED